MTKFEMWLFNNRWNIAAVVTILVEIVLSILKVTNGWTISWFILLIPAEIILVYNLLIGALCLTCYLLDIDGEMWRKEKIDKQIKEHMDKKE
ncbi:MAG: hypothetical protein MJZ37_00305 [Bacilli bacterium]|nr:hypothetical protein [Bacilli bacterium]